MYSDLSNMKIGEAGYFNLVKFENFLNMFKYLFETSNCLRSLLQFVTVFHYLDFFLQLILYAGGCFVGGIIWFCLCQTFNNICRTVFMVMMTVDILTIENPTDI